MGERQADIGLVVQASPGLRDDVIQVDLMNLEVDWFSADVTFALLVIPEPANQVLAFLGCEGLEKTVLAHPCILLDL
ncbi:MAG: hypothetical protein ABSA52_16565 [Candidatus Binatia bacterium]